MWFFGRKKPTVENLRGYKKITIKGMPFVIQRINPFLDFPSDKIPQIFTDYQSVRKLPTEQASPERVKRVQEDMYATIQAGVVEPALSKENISVEDLFRDIDIGIGLYQSILDHSFNHFKGLKKLFFSIKTRYKSYITSRKLSGHYHTAFSSRMQRPQI